MDEKDELEDQLDAGGDNEDADSGSDNSAPPKDESKPVGESKRINDLMSNFNREQARANAAEAKLKALESGQAGDAGDTSNSSDADEFREFARENARTTLFNSDPRLAEYGLAPDDIAGTTLTEMRASMKKHLKLVDGIEGRARNRILAEHGLDPDVATGQGTEKPVSFSTMSDKEFNDFIAERDSRPR
jgi:hypothetical protein